MPQWKVNVKAMVSDDACSSSAPAIDVLASAATCAARTASSDLKLSSYLSPGLVTEPMVDDEYSVGGCGSDGGNEVRGCEVGVKKESLTATPRDVVGSSDDVIVVVTSPKADVCDGDLAGTLAAGGAVQLRIVTTHEGHCSNEEEADREAGNISPPDSAVSDLLDHPYAGFQQQLANAGSPAAAAAAGQQLALAASSTDDDDGYSSRSSVDSPGAHTPWRPEESHEADSASTIMLSRLTDSSALVFMEGEAEMGSKRSIEQEGLQKRRPLERRLSGSSEVQRPVQVVTPVISRRRATIDQAGSPSSVSVHGAAAIAKQTKCSKQCDASMDCDVAGTSVADVCVVTSSTATASAVPPPQAHTRRNSASSGGPVALRQLRVSGPCPLHPLVDHDYCTFAEFSADIQSSIIATTDNRLRTAERKYAAGGAGAAAKGASSTQPEQRSSHGPSSHRHKLLGAMSRRGRHRLLGRVSPLVGVHRTKRLAITGSNGSISSSKQGPASAPVLAERSAGTVGRRRSTSSSLSLLQTAAARARERNDNDPFVYFSRTAPLKPTARQIKKLQAAAAAEGCEAPYPTSELLTPASAPVVGSENAGSGVFDWYQDLAKMKDKEREFCTAELPTSTSAAVSSQSAVEESMNTLPQACIAGITSFAAAACVLERADTLKDSDVVNMVYDMMPKLDHSVGVRVSEVSSSSGGVLSPPLTTPSHQVSQHQEVDNVALAHPSQPLISDASLSALFASVDVNTLFPSGLGLSDLDDISVGDLLTSDYSTVASLLGDLSSVTGSNLSSACADVNTAAAVFATAPMSTGVDASPFVSLVKGKDSTMPLVESTAVALPNKTNSRPLQQQHQSSGLQNNIGSMGVPSAPTPAGGGKYINSSGVSVAVPPELIVVSMHWNDLPGLQIGSQQYVRLVDIHRQVLPAKETAILKRRCQMLGHDVINCTDMQRDFLVRYANAAKSKSTWIVSREAADSLIGFYMDPRIRSEMEEAERQEAPTQQQPSKTAATPLPPVRAPSVVLNNTSTGGTCIVPPSLATDPFSSHRVEVIHSSLPRDYPVKPRPGVPCVILRDGPRVPPSHQTQGSAPTRTVMSQMSCPGGLDTSHKMERLSSSLTGEEVHQQLNEAQTYRQQLRRHHASESEAPPPTSHKVSTAPSLAKITATAAATVSEKQPLSICHKDSHRSGCRGRFQGGYLYLDLYVDRDAACVKCDICLDMLTLRHFAKHMHRQADPDQLVIVSFPQKFELYNFEPTTEEVSMWGEFERKLKRLDPATLTHMVIKAGEAKSDSPSAASAVVPIKVATTATPPLEDGEAIKPVATSPGDREVTGGNNGSSKSAQQQSTISSDAATASSGRHSERLKTRRSNLMDDYEYAARRPNKRRMDA